MGQHSSWFYWSTRKFLRSSRNSLSTFQYEKKLQLESTAPAADPREDREPNKRETDLVYTYYGDHSPEKEVRHRL